MEKTAAERPAVVEKAQGKTEAKTEAKADEKAEAKADTKSADPKSADAKSDMKSAESPADADHAVMRRRRAKTEKIRVILPSPIQPCVLGRSGLLRGRSAVAAPAAPVEAAVAPEERRDANDLARAAIERLRANGETSPRAPEPARAHEAPKAANALRRSHATRLLP